MFFMLSYFNRLINVKRFIRTLKNGKQIEVNPHSRRAIVSRLREALEDIRKTDLERGYVFIPKRGKLSQKIIGEKSSVEIGKLNKSTPKINRYDLHNHPRNTPLSYQDLQVSGNTGNQVFNITPRGDVYRAKILDKFKKNRDIVRSKVNYTEVFGYPGIHSEDNDFVFLHTLHTLLKKDGYIFYRSKLTPKSKQILLDNKESIKKITEAYRQFDDINITNKVEIPIKNQIELDKEDLARIRKDLKFKIKRYKTGRITPLKRGEVLTPEYIEKVKASRRKDIEDYLQKYKEQKQKVINSNVKN
jgi:hypothetical protein